ncbi:hypothetical protein AB0M46_00280 [Dactylosporangium sp. NPDC051485]|uniref:hypothetical protein n=1 Tax=Dactylosporangium sp. NPDC051485 TaxID=3154846 RepID=UPI00343DB236
MTEQPSPKDVDASTRPGRGRDRRHLYPGRPRRIAPTYTEQEVADIASAAAAAGLTPTGFVGEAGLAAARGEQPMTLGRETLAQLQVELFDARVAVGRIGTNLNQGIAALHATGDVPPWLVRAAALCEQRMRRVDGVIARIDRALR